jgi:hypothetical protein
MTYQTRDMAAKPTATTAASVGGQQELEYDIEYRAINLQFMFWRVTGRTVGKDRIGIARMYQAIETLIRISSYPVDPICSRGECSHSHVAEEAKLPLVVLGTLDLVPALAE